MSPAVDWSRVKRLFMQALDVTAEQREAWMEQACAGDAPILAELRSLFAARAAPDRVGDGVAELLSPLLAEEDEAFGAGAQIGAYRLLRELGVGGMGRVYLAERADGQFTHQVALKLIRSELAAPELIQRFLRERDTLARLAHPNIAQLHDGGVSPDGSPYFTLEYVAGEQITTWCDAHRLGVRARVQLLLKVCDAVEHAHRNLIVHRDIKPSNILVTEEGEPKLLDFGIAAVDGRRRVDRHEGPADDARVRSARAGARRTDYDGNGCLFARPAALPAVVRPHALPARGAGADRVDQGDPRGTT
jgi:serine/threonine-protein kinase